MPVTHSRSPRIHNAALAACGIDGEYRVRAVDAAGFATVCAELRAGDLDGANVTMPHKRAAFAACEVHHGDATAAGAVNTMAARDGSLWGWCTDVTALRHAFEAMPPGPVLILGGGGAAAAAVVAASDRPCSVATRTPGAGSGFAVAAGSPAPIPWGTPLRGAVVVNATPLGMAGEFLPPGVVAAATGLVDLAYGPVPTPAVVAALAAGLPVVDGIQLLVDQAAASFEIWTGRAAPRDLMLAAARDVSTLKEA
jgi:shikimate dehydrogenase